MRLTGRCRSPNFESRSINYEPDALAPLVHQLADKIGNLLMVALAG
jgi:hypothetical protein